MLKSDWTSSDLLPSLLVCVLALCLQELVLLVRLTGTYWAVQLYFRGVVSGWRPLLCSGLLGFSLWTHKHIERLFSARRSWLWARDCNCTDCGDTNTPAVPSVPIRGSQSEILVQYRVVLFFFCFCSLKAKTQLYQSIIHKSSIQRINICLSVKWSTPHHLISKCTN